MPLSALLSRPFTLLDATQTLQIPLVRVPHRSAPPPTFLSRSLTNRLELVLLDRMVHARGDDAEAEERAVEAREEEGDGDEEGNVLHGGELERLAFWKASSPLALQVGVESLAPRRSSQTLSARAHPSTPCEG